MEEVSLPGLRSWIGFKVLNVAAVAAAKSLQSCPTRGGDLNCLSPVESQWDKTADTVNKIGVLSLVGRGLEARSQTKMAVVAWARGPKRCFLRTSTPMYVCGQK